MILTDVELDYLQKMIDVELDYKTWGYGEYGGGCSFSKTIDELKYNLWYSSSIFQIDICNDDHTNRLGVRLNDVAGWDVDTKTIIYQNKVYSSSGCTIIGKDPISNELLKSVHCVINKLEENKDRWEEYYKNDS